MSCLPACQQSDAISLSSVRASVCVRAAVLVCLWWIPACGRQHAESSRSSSALYDRCMTLLSSSSFFNLSTFPLPHPLLLNIISNCSWLTFSLSSSFPPSSSSRLQMSSFIRFWVSSLVFSLLALFLSHPSCSFQLFLSRHHSVCISVLSITLCYSSHSSSHFLSLKFLRSVCPSPSGGLADDNCRSDTSLLFFVPYVCSPATSIFSTQYFQKDDLMYIERWNLSGFR